MWVFPHSIGCSLCNTINLQYYVSVSNGEKKMTSKEVRLCIDSYFAYFPVQFTILLMFVSWKFGSKPALFLCI